jgi:tetratricopeptide (TPR) repeat protein
MSLPNTSTTIPRTLTLAAHHLQQNNLDTARELLQEIIKNHPNHSEALHTLGLTEYQSGDILAAINWIDKAIQSNNQIAIFHANISEMYRQTKQLDSAIKHGIDATKINPDDAAAWCNLGIAYFDAYENDLARQCQFKALKIQHNLVAALNNLGNLSCREHDFQQAVRYFKSALTANPNDIDVLANLAGVYLEKEQPDDAIALLNRARQIQPFHNQTLCNLGCAFIAKEQFQQAIEPINSALALNAAHPETLIAQAQLLQVNHQFEDAEKAALQAFELDSANRKNLCMIAAIYSRENLIEPAQVFYDKALTLEPNDTTALLGKGRAYIQSGDFKQAKTAFNQALPTPDSNISARCQLVQMDRIAADNQHLAALINADKSNTLTSNQRIHLNFALGKCYHDTQQFDLAFQHLLLGNQQKRAKIQYDFTTTEQVFNQIQTIFSADFIAQHHGFGLSSTQPVFIIGMPRSGTTLTEQIIASHPDVYGAGELHYLLNIAHQFNQPHAPFPKNLQSLSPEQTQALAQSYLTQLQKNSAAAQRITDKMPSNFLLLGLIHILFPQAKIIHVNRHPVATCFSGFQQQFAHGQHHSYDLSELGQYYRQYHQLMSHWRRILPSDCFLDIQYESIVEDIENEARRLIQYCGLSWSDDCLDFHRHARPIKTASLVQVRQPIYRTSLASWQHYESQLAPLIKELQRNPTIPA